MVDRGFIVRDFFIKKGVKFNILFFIKGNILIEIESSVGYVILKYK